VKTSGAPDKRGLVRNGVEQIKPCDIRRQPGAREIRWASPRPARLWYSVSITGTYRFQGGGAGFFDPITEKCNARKACRFDPR